MEEGGGIEPPWFITNAPGFGSGYRPFSGTLRGGPPRSRTEFYGFAARTRAVCLRS